MGHSDRLLLLLFRQDPQRGEGTFWSSASVLSATARRESCSVLYCRLALSLAVSDSSIILACRSGPVTVSRTKALSSTKNNVEAGSPSKLEFASTPEISWKPSTGAALVPSAAISCLIPANIPRAWSLVSNSTRLSSTLKPGPVNSTWTAGSASVVSPASPSVAVTASPGKSSDPSNKSSGTGDAESPEQAVRIRNIAARARACFKILLDRLESPSTSSGRTSQGSSSVRGEPSLTPSGL